MLAILLLFWLGCGVVAAMLAEGKARSGCGWMILGFLLGPFAILAIAIASPNQDRLERAGLQSRKLRRCPTCAEVVQSAALKCRYCGADMAPLPRLDWLGREIRSR
jgi:hypothetical protein